MKQIRITDRNINKIDKPPVYEYKFEIAKINNKRKYIQKSGFKTKEEAYNAGVQAYNEYMNTGSVFRPREISVHDYMKYWLDSHVKLQLADSTYTNYLQIVDKYINPNIGHYYLHTIKHVTLQNLINSIYNKDLCSHKNLKIILAVLKGAFKYAHLVEPYINTNPSENVKLPKLQLKDVKKKSKIIKDEDMKTILARFKNHPLQYYGILISYYTGLRLSEVYGLTWDCINFEDKTITVNKIAKTLTQHNKLKKNDKFMRSSWFLGDCKTNSSYRTIKISQYLCDELNNFHQQQIENKILYGDNYINNYAIKETTSSKRTVFRIISSKHQPQHLTETCENVDLVMVDQHGMFSGSYCIKYVSKVINNELKIPFNFHMLRHTHATILYEHGALLKDIQNRLGHASFQTTMNTYVENTQAIAKITHNILESLTPLAA